MYEHMQYKNEHLIYTRFPVTTFRQQKTRTNNSQRWCCQVEQSENRHNHSIPSQIKTCLPCIGTCLLSLLFSYYVYNIDPDKILCFLQFLYIFMDAKIYCISMYVYVYYGNDSSMGKRKEPMYSHPILTSIDENPLPIYLAMCVVCQRFNLTIHILAVVILSNF